MLNNNFECLVEIEDLVKLFEIEKRQDLGKDGLDPTSQMLVPEDENFRGKFVARSAGTIAGLSAIPHLIGVYDSTVDFTANVSDGQRVEAGSCIASIAGNKRSILAIERPALDLLCHLSGIASLTEQYVQKIKQTDAIICATRKTNIGLRQLEKWAVTCGGGDPHRIGLYDAILIKDNHIASLKHSELSGFVASVVTKARSSFSALKFIQCEVDTIDQLEAVLVSGVDMVLLDNLLGAKDFSLLRKAVALRNKLAPKVLLEASGGVDLDSALPIAETGVDRISIGALTHSAPILDIGLDPNTIRLR